MSPRLESLSAWYIVDRVATVPRTSNRTLHAVVCNLTFAERNARADPGDDFMRHV